MSWLGDKIEKFLTIIGIKKQPLLEEGKGSEAPVQDPQEEFFRRMRETAVSYQEQQIQEAELAEKAAYNCLATMVAQKKFDDRTHLGESMKKSMHRLQVEENYMEYGHGKEVPVPDGIIRVYREIQRTMHETTEFSAGYGIVKNAELEQLLANKNLNLRDVLIQGGKNISAKILNDFTSQGRSTIEFNSDYDEPLARAAMRKAIMKGFKDYIQEMDNIR